MQSVEKSLDLQKYEQNSNLNAPKKWIVAETMNNNVCIAYDRQKCHLSGIEENNINSEAKKM